jgi:membrane protein implicated in regulation of membrane protease activity
VFAVVTIVSTYAGRRLIGRRGDNRHDPNDTGARLIGREGQVAKAFEGGLGRVFVDGKEWSAQLEGGEPPPEAGGRIQVIGLVGGARLRVRAG